MLYGSVVGVADQIIGRGLVVPILVKRPGVLHGARRDWVGSRGIGIGGRVGLGVSRTVAMWLGLPAYYPYFMFTFCLSQFGKSPMSALSYLVGPHAHALLLPTSLYSTII